MTMPRGSAVSEIFGTGANRPERQARTAHFITPDAVKTSGKLTRQKSGGIGDSILLPAAAMREPYTPQPSSLLELAAATGRTPGNLSRTLRTMERYGLVRLHKGERGKLRPEVPYRDVQLEMTLS